MDRGICTRRLLCYFPLSGCLAGHNSQSSKQIVQDLICDGQVSVRMRGVSPAKPISCSAIRDKSSALDTRR